VALVPKPSQMNNNLYERRRKERKRKKTAIIQCSGRGRSRPKCPQGPSLSSVPLFGVPSNFLPLKLPLFIRPCNLRRHYHATQGCFEINIGYLYLIPSINDTPPSGVNSYSLSNVQCSKILKNQRRTCARILLISLGFL